MTVQWSHQNDLDFKVHFGLSQKFLFFGTFCYSLISNSAMHLMYNFSGY